MCSRLFGLAAWIGAIVAGFVAGRYLERAGSGDAAGDLRFLVALASLVSLMGLVQALAVMRTVTHLLDHRDALERIVNRSQKESGES